MLDKNCTRTVGSNNHESNVVPALNCYIVAGKSSCYTNGMATISEALAIAIQHHQAGRLQAAEQIYRQILAVDPNQADAIHLLGLIAHQVGKHEIAVEYIGRAIGLNGNVAAFHNNLGDALKGHGKLDEAVACYRRALELKPDFAEAHNNLGNALKDRGSWTKRSPATAGHWN